MKLSTRSRYGARLMVRLAVNYGKEPMLLKNIAEEEEISEKYLSQIIIPLKAKGLVNSFRGVKGGYALSRSPKEINMLDVYEAIEGELSLVYCISCPGDCMRTSICVTRDLWQDMSGSIKNVLEKKKLSDLVRKYNERSKKALMYNI